MEVILKTEDQFEKAPQIRLIYNDEQKLVWERLFPLEEESIWIKSNPYLDTAEFSVIIRFYQKVLFKIKEANLSVANPDFLNLFDQIAEWDQCPSKPIKRELKTLEKDSFDILIVDDVEDIHLISKMVLEKFKYNGKGLNFFSAYSGQEAMKVLSEQPEIAVVLLDVVMENENAGLEFVDHIRKNLGNYLLRIILRTGHPGQFPENRVFYDYDINDYLNKTEHANRLNLSVHRALKDLENLKIIYETGYEQGRLLRESLKDREEMINLLQHEIQQLKVGNSQ